MLVNKVHKKCNKLCFTFSIFFNIPDIWSLADSYKKKWMEIHYINIKLLWILFINEQQIELFEESSHSPLNTTMTNKTKRHKHLLWVLNSYQPQRWLISLAEPTWWLRLPSLCMRCSCVSFVWHPEQDEGAVEGWLMYPGGGSHLAAFIISKMGSDFESGNKSGKVFSFLWN